ncbi:hypothetical protein PIB30_039454 [Stylosanthes scabra]|uniref:Uncharacterized protein n=1 Tax=Stylosanthes scabra TaxID=79078 RepID=A0ABU6UEI5_9FABA|nr:hypothetical protein [Stylosanthes scabra]
MAVESVVNNSVLKELVEPIVTRPTARIPVITVVNPCRRALTLASSGVRIAVTNLTPFLPIQSYGGLVAKNHLESDKVFNMRVVGIEFLFPKSPSLLQSDDYSPFSYLFILAPFAFLGHFQSDCNLSRPETLEQTHQVAKSFEIKTLRNEHTCGRDFTSNMADKEWVTGKLVKRLKTQPKLTPKEAMEHMHVDYRIKLSRLLKTAREIVQGNEVEQFSKMRGYISKNCVGAILGALHV